MISSIYTDSNWILFILAVIIAYGLGDISGAQLISRSQGIDIKKEGSGNAGTTNVLRVLGIKSAGGTLAIDVFKGTAGVLIGNAMAGHWCAMLCFVAVVAGHIWPAAYKFKGGKGVATIFGAMLGLNWKVALLALLCVVIGVLVSRMMSMGGSVVAPALFLVFAGLTKAAQMPFDSWLLGAMVAPTPTSALLHSSTMVKAGVFLIIKLAPVLGWNIAGIMGYRKNEMYSVRMLYI